MLVNIRYKNGEKKLFRKYETLYGLQPSLSLENFLHGILSIDDSLLFLVCRCFMVVIILAVT